MAFEGLEARIDILLGRVNDKAQDRMEIYERLREMLNEMGAYGMQASEDLKVLEKQLEEDLFGPSQIETS